MSEVKRIDIAEFREQGFLQEANRQFFHPLGLALEIVTDDETGEAVRLVPLSGTTKVEEMKAPELIQTYYEAGYALPSIVAAIGASDTGCLRHEGMPLDQTVAPIDYEGAAEHDPDCLCESCVPYLSGSVPPPPPPPTPGLGRPETTRKEAWWERAITWLLSRGER